MEWWTDPSGHGTVARDVRRPSHGQAFPQRFRRRDAFSSTRRCFTCLTRLSLSRARDCFSSALVLPPPPPPLPPPRRRRRRRTTWYSALEMLAAIRALSFCRRLTPHRRRFIDVNGLISPVPGRGDTSDHVLLEGRGEVQIDGSERIKSMASYSSKPVPSQPSPAKHEFHLDGWSRCLKDRGEGEGGKGGGGRSVEERFRRGFN